MKRTGRLERRTELARDGDGARRFARRRSRLAPRSQAHHDDRDRQAAVREVVFARDGHRCVLERWARSTLHGAPGGPVYIPSCYGALTFGHRRHASAGGAYVPENANTLCLGHNRWCEDEPDAARALGGDDEPWWLVVREGDPEWEQLGRKAAGAR